VKGRVAVDQHRQSDLVKQRDDPGMRLADSQSAAGPFEPEVMSQQKGEGTASLASGKVALVPPRSYTARCRRSWLEAGGVQ